MAQDDLPFGKLPWKANTEELDSPYDPVTIEDADGRAICKVWFDDAPVHDFNAQQRANIRLMTGIGNIVDALENIIIAHAMGWDMDGVVAEGARTLHDVGFQTDTKRGGS